MNKFTNIALILIILASLDYLGYFPTQILTPESKLSINVASRYVRENMVDFGENQVIDIFNPLAQDSIPTRLNLWLESRDGRTTIYTQTISVTADGFWTSFIENEQYEIKPGQTKQIPLNFGPGDIYWENKTYCERENAKIKIRVKVNYNTKGETHSQEFIKILPVSSLNEYCNKSN